MRRTRDIDRFNLAGDEKVGDFVYRIKSTGRSSHELGPCVVCAKHASDVHMQVEGKLYQDPDHGLSVTYDTDCISRFGHEECLKSVRK